MGERNRDDETRVDIESAYDAFVTKARNMLLIRPERGRQVLEAATVKARAGLAVAGRITAAQGEQIKRRLERDLEQLAAQMQTVGREAGTRLQPERLRDGALANLATALHATGVMLESWSRRAEEAIVHEAGQITSAGTLTCLNCGHVIHLTRTSHVPPCPECLAARFRKTY